MRRTLVLVVALVLAVGAFASYDRSPASRASQKSPASKASAASPASLASAASPATGLSPYAHPSRFLQFLTENKSPVSNLPLSYAVPENYYEDLISATFVNSTKTSWADWYCYRLINKTITAHYALQTEQILASLGLSIYDGAVRMIALSLLGRGDLALQYTNETLVTGTTYQFSSIRQGGNCAGITAFGEANPTNSFCYGGNDANHTHNNVPNQNAFLNQIISDWYAPPNVSDVRCPDHAWWWNNWQPITGDNIWANFIGPLQSAYLNANGNLQNIKDDDIMLMNAVYVFPTVEIMMVTSVGGIARAPYNTYPDPAGGLISVENCVSALTGMRLFRQTIVGIPNSVHVDLVPRIDLVIANLTTFIQSAFNTSSGTFRTTGLIRANGTFQWYGGALAVDCQTWTISALGPQLIDSWFGAGTALNMWLQTKSIAGFYYDSLHGTTRGVGYSSNSKAQVLSGEWTFGAINAVRVLRNYYTDPEVVSKLAMDETLMRNTVEYWITVKTSSGATAVQYANKRYYIPFGWYANPFPALASTGWAVFVDKNYNPFQLGGSYVYA